MHLDLKEDGAAQVRQTAIPVIVVVVVGSSVDQ